MHFRKEFLPYLIVIVIVFVIISTVFYFSLFRRDNKVPTPRQSASPKSSVSFYPQPSVQDIENLDFHPDSSTVVQTIDTNSQQMLNKDKALGDLLPKLPYKGNFFSLEYNYQINSFIATLSASNQSQANEELDQFLKSNQIQNRDWLYNLKINNQ